MNLDPTTALIPLLPLPKPARRSHRPTGESKNKGEARSQAELLCCMALDF